MLFSVSDNSIKTKAEDALKALVDALTLQDVTLAGGASASQVYTGLDEDSVLLPCVVCLADGQWQEPDGMTGTGNLMGALVLRVRTNANDTDGAGAAARASHIARVTALRNGIFVDNLASQLSTAQTEFHCLGVFDFGESATIKDEESWETTLSFSGIFAATDL